MFIQEIRNLASLVQHPWILGGDFNLVRWLTDRSSDLSSFRLMSLFNDLVQDLELIDIPLKNRRYTWCSNRPQPSHSRLDRIFVAPELSLQFTMLSLNALEILVSDHAPLLLNCMNEPNPRRQHKMELFWLTNPHAVSIIQNTWIEGDVNEHALHRFEKKSAELHTRLRAWHCQNFTETEKQLQFCKKTVLFFYQIEERINLA